MNKKVDKQLADYINLKNKLDSLSNKSKNPVKHTENPFEKLVFEEAEKEKARLFPKLFFLSALVFSLLGISLLINSLFYEKLDPYLLRTVVVVKDFISTPLSKPYVVTIGNFKTLDEAKKEAIDLLPRLKQINIKRLPTKYYVLEYEKLSSKQKAYELSGELLNSGFNDVHVRYLKDQ